MVDFLGNELNVGDKIIHFWCLKSGYELTKAEIVGIKTRTVAISHIDPITGRGEKTFANPDRCVKYGDGWAERHGGYRCVFRAGGQCKNLTELVCMDGKCSFYKTKDQYLAENRNTVDVLERKIATGEDVDGTYQKMIYYIRGMCRKLM